MPDLAQLITEARAMAEQPQISLPLIEAAITQAQQEEAHRDEAALWRMQAQALRVLCRHADALAAFESAASCARAAEDPALEAQVQIGSVASLGWLGKFDEAIVRAHALRAVLEQHGLWEDVVKILVNIGGLYFRRDQYEQALESYQQAQTILTEAVETEDSATIARVQTNRANILTHLNRIAEAMPLYQQAHNLFIQSGEGRAAATVDLNVGYLEYVSGEHSLALATLTRARNTFDALGLAMETAKCDADMAEVYRDLNLCAEALECSDRAIVLFDKIGLSYESARTEVGRASTLLRLERGTDAFESLARAEAAFQSQKNRTQIAHVRLLRAQLLLEMDQILEAEQEASAATLIFQEQNLPGWAAEGQYLSVQIALKGNDTANLEGVQRQLLAVRRVARTEGRRWLECRAEQVLGDFFAARNQSSRALHHFRRSVVVLEAARALITSEELHVAFLRDKVRIYENLVAALLRRGTERDIEEAFQSVERSKSRLLLERLQTTFHPASLNRVADGGDTTSGLSAPINSETDSVPMRLAELRAELNRGYHRLQAFRDGDREPLLEVNSDERRALHQLERNYWAALREQELAAELKTAQRYAPPPRVVQVEALQEALQKNETLIEFYVVEDEVCAFLVTREGLRVQRSLATLADVIFAARRLRYHLQKAERLRQYYASESGEPTQAGVISALRQLYDLIFRSIQPLVSTRHIILVLHGILHGLPVHAFHNGESYLIDNYEFVHAPSANVWWASRQRSLRAEHSTTEKPKTLVIGVPGPGIERVAMEVEQIANVLPNVNLYCGEAATLEIFRAEAPVHQQIHIATHALFRSDNPLFSGLRFSNEWLMARDLYDMRLSCDLVTLSACRTGTTFVASGDELFGLTRGFLFAGVRSLVASLWPVDDAVTAVLMIHFYTLLSHGISHADALRLAQQKTRCEYPHPYHWAAFILFGEK